MRISLLLLDVAPDPIRQPAVGIAGLIVVAMIVLAFSAAAIAAFVFLIHWLMRRQSKTVISQTDPSTVLQPNNPNQL